MTEAATAAVPVPTASPGSAAPTPPANTTRQKQPRTQRQLAQLERARAARAQKRAARQSPAPSSPPAMTTNRGAEYSREYASRVARANEGAEVTRHSRTPSRGDSTSGRSMVRMPLNSFINAVSGSSSSSSRGGGSSSSSRPSKRARGDGWGSTSLLLGAAVLGTGAIAYQHVKGRSTATGAAPRVNVRPAPPSFIPTPGTGGFG